MVTDWKRNGWGSEAEYIRFMVPRVGVTNVASAIGTTPGQVREACGHLGVTLAEHGDNLHLANWSPWTPEEDETIRREYPSHGKATKLEGRSPMSIAKRAKKLGICSKYTGKPWGDDEVALLRELWPRYGKETRLEGRSAGSVRQKAKALGLTTGLDFEAEA